MKEKLFLTATNFLLFVPVAKAQENGSRYRLPNPLGIDTVPLLANRVINGILGVVGAVALLYIVWGGVQWMTSQGNSDKIQKGKDTIVWGILGLVMIFSSYVIITFVMNILGDNIG